MFAKRLPAQLSPNRLARLIADRRRAGLEILDLTESNPTTAGFHYDDIGLAAALRHPDLRRYQPCSRGLEAARLAVADYYRDLGRRVPADDIFLTASTSEAYSYAFKLLADPGDEILVPQPSYPLFEALTVLDALQPVPYPLRYEPGQGWRFDPEHLRNLISTRTRAIVAVNPNNPTGSFIRPDELAALNELGAAFDLALIVDEVFLDYAQTLGGRAAASAAGNRQALTLVLSGLSKIVGLPQLKLGWLAASGPESIIGSARERLDFIADTYLSAGAPVQLAAADLLKQRAGFQAQVHRRLADNELYLQQGLTGRADLTMLPREGGWAAILKGSAPIDDEELVCALLEKTGVLVHPGYFYDFQADGFLVLSLLTPPAVFREGVGRLIGFAGRGRMLLP